MPPDLPSTPDDKDLDKTMRVVRNPMRFVFECCITKDEAVAAEHPELAARPFPRKKFIGQYILAWTRHRLLAIPKSRRMLATWTFICLDLWLAMYVRHSKILIISSDQHNSEDLLDRCVWVYDHLPDWVIKPDISIRKGTSGKPKLLTFSGMESSIEAVSSDPDQLRQTGVTLLHVEEFSVWKWAEKSWAAMRPTIQGEGGKRGGKMVVVATAMAGTMFRDLVYDELGSMAADDIVDAPLSPDRPLVRMLGNFRVPPHGKMAMEGVATWINPHNKFACLLVHYTADPDKRSAAWKNSAAEGYSDKLWDQEYEIDFTTWAGTPVYSSFSPAHVSPIPLEWEHHSDYPMIRAWDIGTHACVWLQVIRGEMRVFRVRMRSGAFPGNTGNKYGAQEINVSGLSVFIADCLRLSETWFVPKRPNSVVIWKDIVDPSAFAPTVTRNERAEQVFRNYSLSPIPGATQDHFIRISAVEDWLTSFWRGKPAFQIDPTATLLIDGMSGGHVYDSSGKKPAKGPFSHVCDALEYACTVSVAPQASKVMREERRKTQEHERDMIDPSGNFRMNDGPISESDEYGWAEY